MTKPGMLDELLGMPFEFVISQSFTFLSKPVAVGRMQRQHGRMVNAGDLAKSQVSAIHDALDDLLSKLWQQLWRKVTFQLLIVPIPVMT